MKQPIVAHRVLQCVQCGREIELRRFRQHRTCTEIRCRQKHQRAMRQREQEHEEEFKRRRELRRATAGAAARQLVPDGEVVALIVPSNCSEPCDLPGQRVAAFRRHMEAAIAASEAMTLDKAESTSPAASSREQDPRPRFAELAACTSCRGACCHDGGDKAFLSAQFIRMLRDRNPQLQASEIRDAYVSHIPNRSYEDSCVFHGESGCTLPRELRSDICNEYLCPALKRLRERCASLRESEVVVVVSMGECDDRVDRAIRVV